MIQDITPQEREIAHAFFDIWQKNPRETIEAVFFRAVQTLEFHPDTIQEALIAYQNSARRVMETVEGSGLARVLRSIIALEDYHPFYAQMLVMNGEFRQWFLAKSREVMEQLEAERIPNGT